MIYEILEQVRNTSSKNEKIEILRRHVDSTFLRDYLFYTYSPHINFYMKKLPKVVGIGHLGEQAFYNRFETFAKVLSERVVTGKAAQDHYQQVVGEFDEKCQKLFQWMILKDVKAGFNISTINKVWPSLIFEPGYMRCSLESDVDFSKWGWEEGSHFVQLKADGMFVNVVIEEGSSEFTFMSRQGSFFPNGTLGELENHVKGLATGVVYMGELTVYEGDKLLSRQIGNGILNSALQGTPIDSTYKVRLDLWDGVPYEKWKAGEDKDPYYSRFEDLSGDVFDLNSPLIGVIETRDVNSLEEAKEIADEWMKLGFEGAVVKNNMMPWKDHTSKMQVKLKKEVCVELLAIELVAGNSTSKNAHLFGSIRCQSECGRLIVDIPGFSDAMRQEIHSNWDNEYVNRVMTVKANEILMPGKNNENYSLFLPRFIEWRKDKYEADTLEMIQEQFKNAGA